MKYLYIILSLFISLVVFPQGSGKVNYKKVFMEAESFFLYEDYNEALYLYQILKREFENNPKYDYRIGQCYLNIKGYEHLSINYLENAFNNMSEYCPVDDFKEPCVPIDVYLDLADAYRKNYKIEDAKKIYQRFLEIMDTNLFDRNIILEEIKSCEIAEKMIADKKDLEIVSMPENINFNKINMYPAISADGNTIMFASKLKFYDAVYCIEKDKNGEWGLPVNIIPQLRIDNKIYPTGLSSDGNTALFVYYGDLDGNIYISYKNENGEWSPAEKLNRNINTVYWESHASFANNDKTIYFTSNREGGFGGLDIYYSEMDEDGEWKVPVNLGSDVNSIYDEQSPVVCNNFLFFSSNGHETMGGYDFFISEKKGDSFGTPRNLGYPINTTFDDSNISVFSSCDEILFSRFFNDKKEEKIVTVKLK